MGRKKKEVAVDAPKVVVKNAAYYKQAFNELKEAYDQLYAKNLSLHHEKEEWFQHADKAHKEQEALVAVVKDLVDDTINNLINVEANIGSISVLDVIYNIGIIERVVEAKFNPKTEE
jgi:hypothetical protein